MIYLLVDKDPETQKWVVLKTITYPINVRGLSGIIYGDIRNLTLEVRKVEGFWEQVDVYEGNGEFKEYSYQDVTFDEDAAQMINTYHYVLMNLDIIKTELKNRVLAHRDSLLTGGYEKDGHLFSTSIDNRVVLQGYAIESLIDSNMADVTIRLDDDTDLVLTVAELKAVVSGMAAFTEALYKKDRVIRAAIDSATDYDAIRTAATWDDVPL